MRLLKKPTKARETHFARDLPSLALTLTVTGLPMK